MRLDQALVQRKLCESRVEAKECIKNGYVLMDGLVIRKTTRLVEDKNAIEVIQKRKYVSRGGDKLAGAFLTIYSTEEFILRAVKNKTALDVGSSTGGFTDCLISYGIVSVTAVDVGTSQLHPKLRNESKVTLYENTDIRNFTSKGTFDIIVADVSFIALEKIVDAIISFGHTSTEYFLLIKPQFEVGYGNTKKGIVKDQDLIDVILEKYKTLFKSKMLHTISIFPCSIKGGDGNQEYFIHIQA
jgi:23S rRNA (cytidine1920-2'-O)/16S rRNA (cytidine1409-2'-O)-methyltransferase